MRGSPAELRSRRVIVDGGVVRGGCVLCDSGVVSGSVVGRRGRVNGFADRVAVLAGFSGVVCVALFVACGIAVDLSPLRVARGGIAVGGLLVLVGGLLIPVGPAFALHRVPGRVGVVGAALVSHGLRLLVGLRGVLLSGGVVA